jgi:hypothetical protein
MTRDLYWATCTLAGPWRRGYLERGVNLLSAVPRFPTVRTAVYVACDASGTVAYVGKVARRNDWIAVASRVGEHVTDPAKAEAWAKLYVVPLSHETPAVVVDYLEALTIEFLEPYQNRRRPSTHRLGRLVEVCLSAADAS